MDQDPLYLKNKFNKILKHKYQAQYNLYKYAIK